MGAGVENSQSKLNAQKNGVCDNQTPILYRISRDNYLPMTHDSGIFFKVTGHLP
jgi:hypothetical protein